MKTVKATREGLIGGHTASGWIINSDTPYVALPSEAALRQWVRVINPLNEKWIDALVLDVGPHHTDDDAYVFGSAQPRAESDGSNGAGIDLGEVVWNKLEMKDNTQVRWDFLISILEYDGPILPKQ
jgi:hypothetical protein